MVEYLDEDFERSTAYAIRELTGLPSEGYLTQALVREIAELKRKLEKTNTDVDLADFYRLQAEVTLAQTIRASSILTFSTLGSLAFFIGFGLADLRWAALAWAILFGILLTYRIASLIWPLKYDNLNVMGRRLDLKKAELEVQRTYNNALRKEEAAD